MQQGAREQALEVEIEGETARDEAAQASRERQPADIEVQTPIQIEEVDPENGKRIPNACTPTSRGKVTTGEQPKRGELILFPLWILAGPYKQGWYDVGFRNELGIHRLTTTLPNNTQIIDHETVPDTISGINVDQEGETVETYKKAKRGDVILYPFTILDGPNENGQYGLEFWDESHRCYCDLVSTLPNDTQIIDHDPGSDEADGE